MGESAGHEPSEKRTSNRERWGLEPFRSVAEDRLQREEQIEAFEHRVCGELSPYEPFERITVLGGFRAGGRRTSRWTSASASATGSRVRAIDYVAIRRGSVLR